MCGNMSKTEARNQMKAIRRCITDRAEKDKSVFGYASDLACGYEKIFIYVSFGTEVDTVDIIDSLRENKEIYVPFTDAYKSMHAVLPEEDADFSAVDKCGNVKSKTDKFYDGQADLIFVPLLGFDYRCYRLGYGAGCYDRYFSEFPSGLKVGLAYNEQLCEFEYDKNDVPMDMIITPKGIIRRKK